MAEFQFHNFQAALVLVFYSASSNYFANISPYLAVVAMLNFRNVENCT